MLRPVLGPPCDTLSIVAIAGSLSVTLTFQSVTYFWVVKCAAAYTWAAQAGPPHDPFGPLSDRLQYRNLHWRSRFPARWPSRTVCHQEFCRDGRCSEAQRE